MMGGGLGISGLGQQSSSSHDAEPGASDNGLSRDNTFAEIGQQDMDGITVSDDGDSEWEDNEGSRLFLEYQRRKDRYSFNPR